MIYGEWFDRTENTTLEGMRKYIPKDQIDKLCQEYQIACWTGERESESWAALEEECSKLSNWEISSSTKS